VADQPPGEQVVAYDVRLRVDWTDPPASIGGSISFGRPRD
jgi:hypothetical protein